MKYKYTFTVNDEDTLTMWTDQELHTRMKRLIRFELSHEHNVSFEKTGCERHIAATSPEEHS